MIYLSTKGHSIFFLVILIGLGSRFAAHAQIVVDHSFGSGGALTPTNGNFNLNAGLGKQVGSNLFHSFDEFNVNAGQTATFSGPGGITNVISRVTGPSASNIDGTLRSTIPGADVYLINPNGVVFGPKATLDVKGSFAASTANKLRLKDGGVFHAGKARNDSLTTSPPSAFGFLGKPPKPITVQGSQLAVPAGKMVSLVGGNLTLSHQAEVSAPGGRISAVSVASHGRVKVDAANPAASINTATFGEMGDIRIRGGSGFNVHAAGDSGDGSVVVGTGTLTLNGESSIASVGPIDLGVRHSLQVFAGSQISTTTSGQAAAGNIFISRNANGTGPTGSVVVDGPGSSIRSDSQGKAATGSAGTIDVFAQDLTVQNGGGMTTQAGRGGSATNATGDISLGIVDQVRLLSGGHISATTNGAAQAGTITVQGADPTNVSTVLTGAFLRINSNARVAGILIDGAGSGLVSDSVNGSSTSAGNIALVAKNLMVRNGGTISAVSGPNSGETEDIEAAKNLPGNIVLEVSGTLALLSRGAVSASTTGATDGGYIELNGGPSAGGNAPLLPIQNILIAGTESGISSNSVGDSLASAGGVFLTAENLTVRNGGSISAVAGPNAGSDTSDGSHSETPAAVALSVGDSLQILSGGTISASTQGAIAGGFIGLSGINSSNSEISVPTHSVLIDGKNSGISSNSVHKSSASAGYVDVEAESITVQNGGSISAVSGPNSTKTSDSDPTQGRHFPGAISLAVDDSLRVTSGGTVSTATKGAATGGSITVSGAGFDAATSLFTPVRNVLIDGTTSRLSANSTSTGSSSAGGVDVTAEQLTLQHGGGITTDVEVGPASGGTAATISLHVSGQLDIFSGGIVSDTSKGMIQAGRINVDGGEALLGTIPVPDAALSPPKTRGGVEPDAARVNAGKNFFPTVRRRGGSVRIDGMGVPGTGITASGEGPASAGQIKIFTSGPVELTNGASISTQSAAAAGGNIVIDTQQGLRLKNDSAISTRAQSGGNIRLLIGGPLIAENNAQSAAGISASSMGQDAAGGDITINRTPYLILSDTAVTATSDSTQGGKIVNHAGFVFASSGGQLVSQKAGAFDANGLPNLFDATATDGNSGTVVSPAPDLSLSSTLGQVTYRTPDLIVVNQYPASEKQLAEAKAAAAHYLDAAGKPPAPETPGVPPGPTRQVAPIPAGSAPRNAKHPAAALAEPSRRARRSETPPPPPGVKPGVIAVQVSKKSEGSADTIGVVLIDTVSRQPTSPDVYEISRKRLESGDSVTIEGQSATLVAARSQ